MTKLTIGFSPCPNDTFMFDALVHGKIDTEGLEFIPVIDDVEALNLKALKGEPDISKVSFAAFTQLTEIYQLLNAGSALGKGVGPLLVTLSPEQWNDGADKMVAIPGEHTTANFLFSFFFPGVKNKREMIFSAIEDAVLERKTDAGVIIHENRFTYEKKGLKKICDLGELWEHETGQPIPLGGIVARKNFPEELKQKIDHVIRKSVEFAFSNPASSFDFVKHHAREMDEAVRQKHIETYVNNFSADLGSGGREAVGEFFRKAKQAGMIQSIPHDIFVHQTQTGFANSGLSL